MNEKVDQGSRVYQVCLCKCRFFSLLKALYRSANRI